MTLPNISTKGCWAGFVAWTIVAFVATGPVSWIALALGVAHALPEARREWLTD